MLSEENLSSRSREGVPTNSSVATLAWSREFIVELNNDMKTELKTIDSSNQLERFMCFRHALEDLIEYSEAYKPLLAEIKGGYEDCVEHIQSDWRQVLYYTGKIKALVSETSSIRNYTRRGNELEQKMKIVEDDNIRLQKELADLKASRTVAKPIRSAMPKSETSKSKRETRPIPGLTLHQMTDVRTLDHALMKLERQHRDLSIAHRTRYSPAQVRDHLKSLLEHRVKVREELSEEIELMKSKRYKLKISVEAAQSYLKIQPPHQTIGDVVISSIIKANQQHWEKITGEDGNPSLSFDDDDPAREKEAELMLEYIEEFNELLEDGLVEEAAMHAANSPKGILRTPETLNRFKDITFRTSKDHTPLLAFCDALMSTATAFKVKPNEIISQECVKCVLEENRLDLLVHWISQEWLSLTEMIGKMIQQWCEQHPLVCKRYLSLVHTVYRAVGAHVPAVVCMLQQGRCHQAINYARNQGAFEESDYVEVLFRCPSVALIEALYPSREKAIIPLGVLLTTLLKTDVYLEGLKHLVKLHEKGSDHLIDAVFNDDVTTQEEWQDVCMRLHEQGFPEVAHRLLADVILTCAMQTAISVIDRHRVATAPVEPQPADTEARPEQKAGKKGKTKRARHQQLSPMRGQDFEAISNPISDSSMQPKETDSFVGPSNSTIIITSPPPITTLAIITPTKNWPSVWSSHDILPVKIIQKTKSLLPSSSSSSNTSAQLLKPVERTGSKSPRNHHSPSPRRSHRRTSPKRAPAAANANSEVATEDYDADME